MKKIMCALFSSLILAGCSNSGVPLHTTNQAVQSNPLKNDVGTLLELQEHRFRPDQIEHYTIIPMKFEAYTLEQVKNGVYVSGVFAHSGYQVITFYSKVDPNNSQNMRVLRDDETIKIIIEEKKAESADKKKEHAVYWTKTKEKVSKFEVYRNGNLEEPVRVGFGIE